MNCGGAFTLYSRKITKSKSDERQAVGRHTEKGVPERFVVKNIWEARNNDFILTSSDVELEDSGNLSLKRI
jgi:hypothetical protein